MVIHLLKLIRSRLGGSCWILVELLVVFVILWFMMYYFVAQGMLTRMPVGFKLDHVYNVTLAIRPSDSPSFIAYEEGSEEPVRNIERIVERIERHPDVEVVGLSYYSLPYTDSNIGSRVLKDSINQRVRAMIVSPGHPLRYGRKPGETGADPVGASGGEGDDPLRRSGEQAIRPYRRDRGRDL